MIWTIILFIIAVALFVFGRFLFKQDAKQWSMIKHIVRRVLDLIAIILLIIGVNRCGLGTTYYLTQANPGILQDMANAMQAQRSTGSSKEIKKYLKSNMEEMVRYAPIHGDPNAKKTIFVFSAHSCGYCRRVHSELVRVTESHPDVRVVMKQFSIHGVLSDFAAKATIAAKLQSNEKAAALDDLLFTTEYYPSDMQGKDQAVLEKTIKKNVLELAAKVGLDTKQLEADVNSDAVRTEMAQVRDLAQQFQIGGTPFLIIGDQAFPGAIPYDQIIQALR